MGGFEDSIDGETDPGALAVEVIDTIVQDDFQNTLVSLKAFYDKFQAMEEENKVMTQMLSAFKENVEIFKIASTINDFNIEISSKTASNLNLNKVLHDLQDEKTNNYAKLMNVTQNYQTVHGKFTTIDNTLKSRQHLQDHADVQADATSSSLNNMLNNANNRKTELANAKTQCDSNVVTDSAIKWWEGQVNKCKEEHTSLFNHDSNKKDDLRKCNNDVLLSANNKQTLNRDLEICENSKKSCNNSWSKCAQQASASNVKNEIDTLANRLRICEQYKEDDQNVVDSIVQQVDNCKQRLSNCQAGI